MKGYVLGPVKAVVPGRQGVEGASKLAGLFALFVLSSDHRVERDDIAHHLWPNGGATENRISRQLSYLRDGLGGRVSRMKSGVCSMDLSDSSIDYLLFREDVRRSRGMNAFERFSVLRGALERWSGEGPLLGLPGAGFELQRTELRREWGGALVNCMAAAWEIRDDEWLLKEAEGLLGRFSVNRTYGERIFLYRLMATAARSLHTAKQMIKEYKERYGRPRDLELDQAIRDIARGAFRHRPAPARFEHPIPRQLPFADRELVGQARRTASLRQYLAQRRAESRGAVILLTGMAGAGKSALANHLCRGLEPDFPDGTLYASLNGFTGEGTSPAEPRQILSRFLSDLGVQTQATDLDALSGALRSRLATRSVVMLLDDAAHAGQVLPLLPGTGTSVVVITSRNQLPDLSARKDVHICRIGPLDRESAAEIVFGEMAPGARRKCGPSVDRLVDLCGRLPLALSVIARRVRGRPPQGVAELVTRLSQEHQRLEELHQPGHDLSVRLALDCSVGALSTEARSLLWQLALHPGPSIDWAATMDLGSVAAGGDTDRALDELIDANLVECTVDRYRLHDLVRAYARYHVFSDADRSIERLREETVRQVLEHQLQNVAACDRVIDPQRSLPIEEPRGLRVVDPASEKEAMAYVDAEYEVLLQGIDLALRSSLRRYVWLLSMALVSYQWRRSRHADAERRLTEAEEASRGLASSIHRAMVYRMLAGTQMRAGHVDLGLRNAEAAVRLGEEQGDVASRLGLARSLHLRAVAYQRGGDLNGAEEGHRLALELFEELGDAAGAAGALNGIGTVQYERGAYDKALRMCDEALRIFELTDDANGRANVLTTLAKIHTFRSEQDEALRLYERAIAIYRKLSYWPNEAKTLSRYAYVLVSSGRTQEAVTALERVVMLCEFMGDEEGVQQALDRLESLR
ncbi:tetratricopeptide repeat protein [Streptomyces celluloflavus]|uniref:tetratricopeptide repeat protein n=1 Tax=Streptomyces celluloflavus TaxID=58344 RepID=UPI003691F449